MKITTFVIYMDEEDQEVVKGYVVVQDLDRKKDWFNELECRIGFGIGRANQTGITFKLRDVTVVRLNKAPEYIIKFEGDIE